ncbi:MATE family efflux transporter [Mangrovicoccus algicola]|uniref:Polysaccharide biosynthesis C-terminal domain-containing protein n=1 Tax=Mangrovicoccus algicola TaxID=2771008 RepID=A0A8J6YV88_9RHOB|nr:MATE family efflux transporter [Mangrovicoccus algicola]MBE3636799.1 polysaccharide biosynthesis C-terminal domain-containing protein [Mangrovicoccus algicola]
MNDWRALLGMSWPMCLRMLMLHGTVVLDAWLVAGLGEAALAAMGLAAAVASLLLGALMAFSNAAQILVAQAWGTGRRERMQANLVTGLAVNGAVALLGLALLALLAGPVLEASGQGAAIRAEAGRYLAIFSLVILAEAAGQSLSAFFNGRGLTRAPFLSYALTLPVNVLVSWLLIYGVAGLPELGLAGAAIGTALAAVLRGGYLWALTRRAGYRLGRADLAVLRGELRPHLAFSLPVAATFFSAHASSSVCMLIYARYDTSSFAALTIIMPWINVVGTLGMAWAQATGILVAQRLARRIPRAEIHALLRRAAWGAMLASLAVSVFYGTVILASRRFYPTLQPATYAALASFLPFLLLLPWPKNLNAICGNTLRAAGRTIYVMHIFLWSQWLFKVPASAAAVLWLKAPVSWVVAIMLLEEVLKFLPFHAGLLGRDWYATATADRAARR